MFPSMSFGLQAGTAVSAKGSFPVIWVTLGAEENEEKQTLSRSSPLTDVETL